MQAGGTEGFFIRPPVIVTVEVAAADVVAGREGLF